MHSPPITADGILRCFANDELHLILMPTEACNFRCSYCYEDFRFSRMAATVVRGIKHLIARRAPTLRKLRLEWFGGEPLLAFDVIEDILTAVQGVTSQHAELALESDMTTNGFLLSRHRLSRLVALGVRRYQVTLDGPRRYHDGVRLRADGGGTFDRIWDNLCAASETKLDFSFLVRLHVNRENRALLPAFIRDYAHTLGGDQRFTLLFRLLACLGGVQDATLPVFDAEGGSRAIADLCRIAESHGVRHATPQNFEPICYAARGNSYVVRADGRLNKCTVALEHRNNQVGHLDADGNMHIDPRLLQQWMRGLFTGDAEMLSCPRRGYAQDEPATTFQIVHSAGSLSA